MTHKIVLQPSGLSFECSENESLLSAGQAIGIRYPVSCKNGVCHVCRGVLKKGSVKNAQGRVFQATSEISPEIYVCHVCPTEDCELVIEGVYGPGELPMKTIQCQVVSVNPMQSNVYRVILRQPAGKPCEFFPGQYLAIKLPDREFDSYFSIACAPNGRELELHIQADPHLEKAKELVGFLSDNLSVTVELAFGKACLHDMPEQEVLLLAAGTGFAQMKSIIEYLLKQKFVHPLRLYWTARKESDLYALEQLERWKNEFPNFAYRTIFADVDHLATDHHSLMADAVLEDHDTLSDMLVFASGSPRLVYSTMDALEASGLKESQFRSDVLEYAKREDYK